MMSVNAEPLTASAVAIWANLVSAIAASEAISALSIPVTEALLTNRFSLVFVTNSVFPQVYPCVNVAEILHLLI